MPQERDINASPIRADWIKSQRLNSGTYLTDRKMLFLGPKVPWNLLNTTTRVSVFQSSFPSGDAPPSFIYGGLTVEAVGSHTYLLFPKEVLGQKFNELRLRVTGLLSNANGGILSFYVPPIGRVDNSVVSGTSFEVPITTQYSPHSSSNSEAGDFSVDNVDSVAGSVQTGLFHLEIHYTLSAISISGTDSIVSTTHAQFTHSTRESIDLITTKKRWWSISSALPTGTLPLALRMTVGWNTANAANNCQVDNVSLDLV